MNWIKDRNWFKKIGFKIKKIIKKQPKNSEKTQDMAFGEPIWIWRKK